MRTSTISDSKYASIHYWLKKNFGVATKCENNNCLKTSKVFNWAKIKDKRYVKKRENFIQLCRSCHAKYDCTEKTKSRISKKMKGKKPSLLAILQSKKLLTGVPRKQSTKDKIRTALLGYEARHLWRLVYQFDLEGNIIKKHESLKSTGYDSRTISNCCRGKLKTAYGYRWSYTKRLPKYKRCYKPTKQLVLG